MLTGFVSPTKEAVAAAKIFGLELNSNTLRTIGMTGAMQLLANATIEETAAIFPNVRALLGSEATRKNVVALIGDHKKALNAAGLAEIAYRKNAATTEIALAKNRELWISIKRDLGEGIAPQVNTWLQGMSLLAKEWKFGWTSMVNAQKNAQAEINAQLEEPDIITKFNLSRKKEADDLVNAAKEFAKIQKSVMKDIAEKEFVGPIQIPTAKVDTGAAEEAEKIKQAARDQTEAYRRMYDDLGEMGNASYENRLKLLNYEKEDYATFIKDKELLDQWYSAKKGEIDTEMKIASDEALAYQKAQKSDATRYYDDLLEYEADRQKAILDGLGGVGDATEASLSSAFKNMITEGESLSDAMDSVFASIGASFAQLAADMIAQELMLQSVKLMLGIGGGIAGIFGAGAGAGAAGAGAGAGAGTWGASAKGNIFSNGSIVPFAKGDILASPTIFPMSNGGIGLGGEAGKEAIMPLGRDNQGRLGIRTEGDNGSSKTPIKIINVMDYSMVQEYLSTGDGERTVVNIMRRNANEIQDVVG